jgi:NTE family protein
MNVALVLGGGVALGAYHAGAYAALHEQPELRPARIAGSSVGAVAGALIAGNAPGERVARLRKFWDDAALDAPWSPLPWASILHVRMFGRPGFFNPRVWPGVSVYDPAPLQRRLDESIDFERLNRASFSVTTTDVESGEPVVFDTRRGDRIAAEHLVASCGFLPDFPPLEIDGRLLGDGGLVANTPVERAIDWDTGEEEWTVFVLDLFARKRARPASLDEAAARRMDLLFGNQTRQALQLLQLELRASGRENRVRVLHLAYRAPVEEGGPEKPFNFSRATLTERWAAGARDMEVAIASLES